MFNCGGEEVRRLQFQDGGNYNTALREGSFEMYGDRVIKLGTNMWAVNHITATLYTWILW